VKTALQGDRSAGAVESANAASVIPPVMQLSVHRPANSHVGLVIIGAAGTLAPRLTLRATPRRHQLATAASGHHRRHSVTRRNGTEPGRIGRSSLRSASGNCWAGRAAVEVPEAVMPS
jgi:hypothetical protein